MESNVLMGMICRIIQFYFIIFLQLRQEDFAVAAGEVGVIGHKRKKCPVSAPPPGAKANICLLFCQKSGTIKASDHGGRKDGIAMRPISEKQREILAFIRDYTDGQGYPPSVREIASAVGLRSPSSVHAHLKRLRELGYLEKDDHKTRAITLAGGGAPGGRAVPVLGRVTAGMPILAVEEVTGVLHVDVDAGHEYFALCIRGDSMVGAGILDGDYIVVRRQNYARRGQIVVAVLEDEATCKRLEKQDGHVWLVPENPAYRPILGDHAHILGVVARVVRSYPL